MYIQALSEENWPELLPLKEIYNFNYTLIKQLTKFDYSIDLKNLIR